MPQGNTSLKGSSALTGINFQNRSSRFPVFRTAFVFAKKAASFSTQCCQAALR
jgi:hypothetical protein